MGSIWTPLVRKSAQWDEEKHPRADDGKFGSGSGGGKESPPKRDSEGGKDHAKNRTKTEAFKKWFGDSKVVDENGEPLVVYHGTNRSFDQFDKGRQRSARNDQFQGDGFFFTTDPDTAAKYADAAANQGFDKETAVSEMHEKHPGLVADLFQNVVEYGHGEGFDKTVEKYGQFSGWDTGGVDVNDVVPQA